MNNWIKNVRGFFQQVWEELLKCTRPTGAELKESTVVIVSTMAAIGAYILVCDSAITMLLSAAIRFNFSF
ncbi:MAG: preprotein translocase subunit SecE [Verrucomicrobiae bacterium]|nr:preprotein translocase subunit SecE [Verrucomicrobiae bacterium]